jgi:hypothetical protein
MRWPWSSSSADDKSVASTLHDKLADATSTLPTPPSTSSSRDRNGASSTSTASSSTELSWTHFRDPRNLASAAALTATALLGFRLYTRHLRRIPTVAHIRPHEYRRRTLLGRVTSVGDADNLRMFHTPGGRLAGWGWLPWRRVPTKREALKDQTVSAPIPDAIPVVVIGGRR